MITSSIEPLSFTTVFAQFKISYESLSHVPADHQRTLEQEAWAADWVTDSVGALLSPVLPLAVPSPGYSPGYSSGQTSQEQVTAFPWGVGALRGEAAAMAQAQLLVCDVISESSRGPDTVLRFSGHVADEHGQALTLFGTVPRPLLLAAERRARQSLLGIQTKTRVLAYRAVSCGESVLSLEALLRCLPRKRLVNLIKQVQVYEHHLERRGAQFWHHCHLRAHYQEYGGGQLAGGQHVQPLGSTRISDLLLHALSAPTLPYAHLEGQSPPRATLEARRLLDGLVRPAVKAPVQPAANRLVKVPPTQSAQVETAAADIAQQALADAVAATAAAAVKEEAVPKAGAVLAEEPVLTEEPVLAQEPVFTEEPVPGKAVAEQPVPREFTAPPLTASTPTPDLWDSFQGQLVIDRDVLDTARVALSLARPLLIEGAPGTGKTLLATLLAEALCGPGNFTLVTADARWTSSDVLGGLRVAPGDSLRYVFQPGVVTQAAQRHHASMQSSGRPHALIIDEFNRAHQDEAFGRLLTLLDPEYRSRMPLVSEADGASGAVYLPPDFLLLATMNDADVGRLHEIGAALTRRFVALPLSVPREERAFLEQHHAAQPNRVPLDQAQLNMLYAFVGSGQVNEDRSAGRFRAYVTVGTHFMREALALTGGGLSLDNTLKTLTKPHLVGLNRDSLTALHHTATQVGFQHLAAQLQASAEAAPF